MQGLSQRVTGIRMTDERRDYRQEVTNEVIALLEQGAAPWQRPWQAGEFGRTPFNPVTTKPYHGGNILNLMISAMRHGYSDPRWLTYKQSADKGWQVRKGEKSTKIEFWEAKPGNKEEGADDDEKRSRLIHRVYSVFNAEQIDGIPLIHIEPRKPFEVIEAGEKMLSNSGAEIKHGGGRAFYSPKQDYIQMPPRECFTDEPHYYATVLHELAHWTGAGSRLNRLSDKAPFGSPAYAAEEIRADLASLMISAELGIPYDPKDQAGYIQNWIQVLKNDKNEVFKAASDASKICDYLHSLENGKVRTAQPGPHTARVSEEVQARQARSR
jgi:antirestriction protein ArdC